MQQPIGLNAEVSGYARLLRKRRMGKVSFWTVRFKQQDFQLLLEAHVLKEYGTLSKIPIGSNVWFYGITCLSNSQQFSVRCLDVTLISPCTLLFPSKQGVQAGKRYADHLTGLLAESESFDLFRRITEGTKEIRKFLWESGFDEFSTGVLQKEREAGTADMFTTYCNAAGREYTLGLTSELKLRRLQVAGFENVFEILQSFRNEGMDSMHSPEFTLLEVCAVGKDCEGMMVLLESLLETLVKRLYGRESIPSPEGDINVCAPFTRIGFYDACEQFLNLNREECTLGAFISRYPQYFADGMGTFTWVFKVINKLLGPHFRDPTFVTHIPAGISPLVRVNTDDSAVSDRAALLIQGIDIADVYADENDSERVRQQMQLQFEKAGVPINEAYLHVLEYGMPPSASLGMGLNRLFMTMRGSLPANIRETILFPL